MVKNEKRKRTLDYAWPVIILSIKEMLYLPIKIYFLSTSTKIDIDWFPNDEKIEKFLNDNSVYLFGIKTLIYYWMTERVINLIRKQNLKILAPFAAFIFIHANSRLIE